MKVSCKCHLESCTKKYLSVYNSARAKGDRHEYADFVAGEAEKRQIERCKALKALKGGE